MIDEKLGSAIQALWADPGIRKTWDRRAEFQIVESVKYYFNEIERIMGEGYVATQQDMLLARVRTSGIVTERYVIDSKSFEMYDVGGQRNERKKWERIIRTKAAAQQRHSSNGSDMCVYIYIYVHMMYTCFCKL